MDKSEAVRYEPVKHLSAKEKEMLMPEFQNLAKRLIVYTDDEWDEMRESKPRN